MHSEFQLDGSHRLSVPAAVRAQLDSLARSGYPQEVCGLLVGSRNGGDVVVRRAEPVANLETERADDRYRLDPDAFLTIDRAARREGLDIVGIWHTHPDHPPRPSATDLELAWPGYVYLILAVADGTAVEPRAWALKDGGFVEQPIVEEPPVRQPLS